MWAEAKWQQSRKDSGAYSSDSKSKEDAHGDLEDYVNEWKDDLTAGLQNRECRWNKNRGHKLETWQGGKVFRLTGWLVDSIPVHRSWSDQWFPVKKNKKTRAKCGKNHRLKVSSKIKYLKKRSKKMQSRCPSVLVEPLDEPYSDVKIKVTEESGDILKYHHLSCLRVHKTKN